MGEASASARSDPLFARVYDELHRLASGYMRHQPAGQTLQTTALVHEAYLRLFGRGEHGWRDRGHFLGAMAGGMWLEWEWHPSRRPWLRWTCLRGLVVLAVAGLEILVKYVKERR